MISILFYCITLLLLADGALCAYYCDMINIKDGCEFTVSCQKNPRKIKLPSCDYDPNVTFVITDSTVTSVTSKLFAFTNFDYGVKIIKNINCSWHTIEPHAFKYYPRTIEADFSAIKLSIIKDYAFKELEDLQRLNLSTNFISDLNPNSLDLSNTTELVSLDLSHNSLKNLKSYYFSYLSQLEYLNLDDNFIRTIDSDCFKELRKLKTLKLKNNLLYDLNNALINLTKLKYLDVSKNHLFKLSGYDTKRLVSLEVVNMSRNVINSFDDDCFSQAFNLETIDFSYNSIESNITYKMFGNSSKLKYLNLFSNLITKIEDNSFEHSTLDYFNIEKNFITLEITKTFFRGLQNVTKLSFQQQYIEAIRNQSFSGMNQLLYFNASKNYINIIEKTSFSGADSLQILDLSYNSISELTFLKDCLANVTELYLSNNNLTNLPRDSFIDQTSLIRLDISMNNIVSLEPQSLPLYNLQYLNILGNNFSGVITKNIFNQAHTLRYLDVSNFKFNKVDANAFEDIPSVARMNLSHNEIDFINSKNFINMHSMFSLDLSCNRLTQIILNDSSLNNLKALYLNNNRITDMSMSIVNASSITYLDLSHNNISDVSNVFLKQLPNLLVLNLSNNKIKIFNNQVTNSLSKLTHINLASNLLDQINLTYYHDLISADLSNNQLCTINGSLDNLNRLNYLDLASNNILDLIPGTFQSVKALQILNISRNNLSDLRPASLKGLQSTQLLDLSRNSISDLNSLIFHNCTKLMKLIVDYNNINRFDVENLMTNAPKLTTLSVGGNPVSCKDLVRCIKLGSKTSSRQIEVTSIDKIYHDANVYGIKCGDVAETISGVNRGEAATAMLSKLDYALICLAFILVCVSVLGVLVIKLKHRKISGHLQFRSLEMDNYFTR